MTVTDVRKDPTALTMTVASEWDAPIARVWQLWADPRKLERWWGPPTYPATVVEHDLRPGGKVSYFMTSPEGEQHHGWWKVVAVDEPHRLDLEDGFADTDGNPNDDDADDAVHRHLRRAAERRHAHAHRDAVPVARGDGPADRDGHGGGPRRRHGPDRRHPRGGLTQGPPSGGGGGSRTPVFRVLSRGFSERSQWRDLGSAPPTGSLRRSQPRCDVPPGHGARPGGKPLLMTFRFRPSGWAGRNALLISKQRV